MVRQSDLTARQRQINIAQNGEIYSIAQWSEGYFAINANGHVSVQPNRNQQQTLDLYTIVNALLEQGLSLPVLIRFSDILRDRVLALLEAFQRAAADNQYHGGYTAVYPLKVNQQRKVIEAILAAEKIGLEAGSKAELLAIIGLSGQGVVICNGYKDRAYIRYALMGLQMGLDLYIVIEKLSELEMVLSEAKQLNIVPRLGVRIRLSSISSGIWQNSGGEKSKFGFHADGLLRFINRLQQVDQLGTLQLMHFHMGSQIADIEDIKRALREAGQYFAQLHGLGAAIRIVNAGGGLGIDYEGRHSCNDCSVNYTVDEYAQQIIRGFSDICRRYRLPHPHIITESGRALAAHHAVLITNIIEVESVTEDCIAKQQKCDPVASYQDAQFDRSEAHSAFLRGKLDLETLAVAEKHYTAVCLLIQTQLNANKQVHLEVRQKLEEELADKVFCNFSLFQSLPDIWGLDQVFPIMPIHHLDEAPTRRAVIQDLTCDSDGRVDRYVDSRNIEKTLPLHKINVDESYLLGFFLVGAYQEILGDMHNMFGDTHSVNIELDKSGYHISEPLDGEQVSDLLQTVHIDPEQLKLSYQQKLSQAGLNEEQQKYYTQELSAGLTAYTYLEK